MENKNYQKWALTKDRTYHDLAERIATKEDQLRMLHAVLGISGETGELVDAIKKHVFYNKELDIVNVKEEIGDCFWYFAILLETIGSSFEEVMQLNHDKLEKRYPSGFTEKAAIERADKQ